MDNLDKNILHLIQKDGTLSTTQIGQEVGLSSMPVWRRLQRMKEAGIIKKTVSLIDRKKLNLSVIAIIMLRTNRHDLEWFNELADFVKHEDSVLEFYRMSGEVDFLLKVALVDMEDYQEFYTRMIGAVRFMDVSTSFAFEAIKETTALPV